MSSQFQFKEYHPQRPSRAPRITDEQWQQYKSPLKALHVCRQSRAKMLEWLGDVGFHPSAAQLTAKMAAWGYRVYGARSTTTNSYDHLELSHLGLSMDLASDPYGRGEELGATAIVEDETSGHIPARPIASEPPDGATQTADLPTLYRSGHSLIDHRDEHIEGPDGAESMPKARNDNNSLHEEIAQFITEWASPHARSHVGVHISGTSPVVDMDRIMSTKPCPKSVSDDSHSSWSFHRVTGFPKGGIPTITESLDGSMVGTDQTDHQSGPDRLFDEGLDTRQNC